MASPRLGPYLLVSPHALGGMAEVWRAVHVPTGERAAIKLGLTGNHRTTDVAAALRAEARALALLDHTHILHAHDLGEVDAAASDALGGRILPGSPWLATEFASGGTLAERVGLLSALAVRELLMALLGALGHAHARGLVHRDLKPSNVLYVGFPAVPKLADFGVAWTRADDEGCRPLRALTLAYMAPEQFAARGPVEGPWTDLYQLGCLAWEVFTGASPFSAVESPDALRTRLVRDLPTFSPRVDVPDGVVDWLATCLAADPASRFLDAADAAHALRQLAWAPGPAPAPMLPRVSSTATTVPRAFDPSPVRAVRAPRRPVERSVWPAALPSSSHAMAPDGLGLVAWRLLGLAGLDAPLAALGARLRGVVASGGPDVVLVCDEGGGAAVRVVDAFGAFCGEHGLATVLRIPSGPDRAGRSPLDRAVARALGTVEPGDVGEALRTLGVEDRVLVALWEDRLSTAPSDGGVGPFRHLVHRLATHRPVLLVTEEASWDDAAPALARSFLLGRRRLPVLLAMAVADAPPAEPPSAVVELQRIGAHVVGVPPLGPADLRRALGHVAPFAASALDALLGAAGGDPGVALARLGALHRAGRVVATARGLRLLPGALPSSVSIDVGARAAALLARSTPERRRQLSLLALLGPEADADWWRRAADRLGAGPVDDAAAELLADGLGTLAAGGNIVLRAAAASAWAAREERAALHAALADTASGVGPRVLHLLRAGRVDGAWDEIWQAIAAATATAIPRAVRLLAEFEDALPRSGIPAMDPRVLQVRRLEGRVFDTTGRLSQGLGLVQRLLAHARSNGDASGVADCLGDSAHFHARFGHMRTAQLLCQEAREAAAGVDDPDVHVRLWWRWAMVASLCHDARNARDALDRLAGSGHPYAQTRLRLIEARLAEDAGDRSLARLLLQRGVSASNRAADPRGMLLGELALGELCVRDGDVLAARAWYRSAQRGAASTDDVASAARARAGLARCAMIEDDEGAAERHLALVGVDPPEGLDGDLAQLVGAAHLARHADVPDDVWVMLDRLEADGAVDADTVDILRLGARRADRAGSRERAAVWAGRAQRHADLLGVARTSR